MKILLIISLLVFLEGCFTPYSDPLFVYRYAELVKIQPVKIYADCPGYYIYWDIKGSQIRYEPLYVEDTAGMGFRIGMHEWVPLKR